MRDLDGALAFSELDRRDVNVAGRQRDRLFEIVPIAIALKLCVGYGADGAARSRTIHANDFAAAVGNADDAQVVVPRLRGKFRREPRRQPAPLGRRKDAGPVGDVAGTSHLIDGQAQHIGPGTTDHRFEFGCEKLYVTAKALQRSRHGDAQEIAVGEHPSHCDRDQNERHHGDGQTRGKLHGPGAGIARQENGFERPPRVISWPRAEMTQISSNAFLQPSCAGAALCAWVARGQGRAPSWRLAIKHHGPSSRDRIIFLECSMISCRYFQQRIRAWEVRVPTAMTYRVDYVFGSARNSRPRAGRARTAAAKICGTYRPLV